MEIKIKYQRPAIEIVEVETMEGIMSLSGGNEPATPDADNTVSNEKNFWGW